MCISSHPHSFLPILTSYLHTEVAFLDLLIVVFWMVRSLTLTLLCCQLHWVDNCSQSCFPDKLRHELQSQVPKIDRLSWDLFKCSVACGFLPLPCAIRCLGFLCHRYASVYFQDLCRRFNHMVIKTGHWLSDAISDYDSCTCH